MLCCLAKSALRCAVAALLGCFFAGYWGCACARTSGQAQLARLLARRQVAQWIDGFAVAAHFEVEFYAVGIGFAHMGNGLAFADRLAFFYQQFAVVCIDGEQGAVVFENNQVAVAAQARACVHDLAIGAGHNGVTFFATNANAFVFRIIKGGNDGGVFGWPD